MLDVQRFHLSLHTWNNEKTENVLLLHYLFLFLSLCIFTYLVKYVINNFTSKLSRIKYDFHLFSRIWKLLLDVRELRNKNKALKEKERTI